MSWLPTALTFGSLPSPPAHPSQHPILGGNLHSREGIRMQLEEQLKCYFTAACVSSSALTRASTTAAEGGRGVPCAKENGKGKFVQEAPCASPGHLSRAQEQVPSPLAPQDSPGAWGLWWLHCDLWHPECSWCHQAWLRMSQGQGLTRGQRTG